MEYNNILKNIKDGQIENIYYICGHEQYLCEEIILEIEKKILDPSFKDLNYEYMEGNDVSTQRIVNACETLPFMDQWRLIIIKNFEYLQGGNSKGNEEEIENLIKYLNKISPSTCLIFWQGDSGDKRKKLYKAIKKSGKILEFRRLNKYEFEKWLERKVTKRGTIIKKSVLKLFIENSNYLSKNSSKTLRDIDNEINKIIDYIGDRKEITKVELENLLPASLENDIFKMVDALGKRDKKTALRLLNDMLSYGENGIKILTMIARQFRILIQCKELKDMGYSPDLIAGKLGLAPFVVEKGFGQSQYFSQKTLKEALNSTLEIDLKMKTGKVDTRLALEMLIFEYAK